MIVCPSVPLCNATDISPNVLETFLAFVVNLLLHPSKRFVLTGPFCRTRFVSLLELRGHDSGLPFVDQHFNRDILCCDAVSTEVVHSGGNSSNRQGFALAKRLQKLVHWNCVAFGRLIPSARQAQIRSFRPSTSDSKVCDEPPF